REPTIRFSPHFLNTVRLRRLSLHMSEVCESISSLMDASTQLTFFMEQLRDVLRVANPTYRTSRVIGLSVVSLTRLRDTLYLKSTSRRRNFDRERLYLEILILFRFTSVQGASLM